MARVAFILADMFEDSEFKVPYDRIRSAGHDVVVVGSEAGTQVKGKRGEEIVRIDRSIDQVEAHEVDALVIPGGYSPDRLRADPRMVVFTQEMYNADKPVAAVCHGPWMLAEADVLDGRTVTSWPSIRTDLINAGARWVDREVVEDGTLITSRRPEDLEVFSEAILRQLDQDARGRPPRIGATAAELSAQPPLL